jgi:hypothetical protein
MKLRENIDLVQGNKLMFDDQLGIQLNNLLLNPIGQVQQCGVYNVVWMGRYWWWRGESIQSNGGG